MAGVKHQNIVQKLDGQSFVPYLKNPQLKEADRPLIFHYPNKWTNLRPEENSDVNYLGINYFSAIRYGKWKLLYSMRDQTFELFDLSKDIREQNNLADQNPPEVKKLATLLGTTLKARGAQMPVAKTSGKAVPFPDEVVK
jgi:arylsulfatase A-like enzyme